MSNTETKFEAGRTYYTRSVCDHECIFRFEVVRRTARSVWIVEPGSSKPPARKAISVWQGVETIKPHGSYSMAPILSADRAE